FTRNFSKKALFLGVSASLLCLFFIIQFAKMGTKVCDAKKDAIIAKATAIDKGMNMSLGIPVMINAGVNTARIQSNINNLGIEIANKASTMARCFPLPISICWWIFSIVTVASSTKMPIERARPLNVMMLMVWPKRCNTVTAERMAIGIVNTTIT